MKANEGLVDRVIRVVVGGALIGVAAAVLGIGTVWGVVVAIVGMVLVVTAAVGFCPAYAVLGLKTCPIARKA